MVFSNNKLKLGSATSFYTGIAFMIFGGILVMVFSSNANDTLENLGFTTLGLGGTLCALGISLNVEANKIR